MLANALSFCRSVPTVRKPHVSARPVAAPSAAGVAAKVTASNSVLRYGDNLALCSEPIHLRPNTVLHTVCGAATDGLPGSPTWVAHGGRHPGIRSHD